MRLRQFPQLLRLAAGAREYLRSTVTHEQAVREVSERLSRREERFLRAVGLLLHDPRSPYRALLRAAGCELGDVRRSVNADGVEGTLERLRDEGVYVSLDELNGRVPIRRSGLVLETSAGSFDNPLPSGRGVPGTTSGSRSRPRGVNYTWGFLAEEAASELLLQQLHGVWRTPLALWFPGPPSMAGLHNLLLDVKLGRPPGRWFSQLAQGGVPASPVDRLAVAGLYAACALAGWSVPRPELAEPRQALPVLDWASRHPVWTLKTYASSAVRLAEQAAASGRDLRGGLVFCGGEPLTAHGRALVEGAGARAVPRYVATETGLVAAGCGRGSRPDAMHVYLDRLGVIPARGRSPERWGPLLWTALSKHAPKLLLNADLGDGARLARRACDCTFGGMGLDLEISGVQPEEKLTIGGVTLLAAEFDALVGELVREAGGTPEHYQFWETEEPPGVGRLRIALSPDLEGVDEEGLARAILASVRGRAAGGPVAAGIWERSGTLEIVRVHPELSVGSKRLRVVRR